MEEKKKLGQGPAFPCEVTTDENGIIKEFQTGNYSFMDFGMSKRFFAAAMAMQGLLAQAHEEYPQMKDMEGWNYEVIAKCAIKAADELLKQENEQMIKQFLTDEKINE
jgi:hypothetical protein